MSIRNRLDDRELRRQLRIAYRYFSVGRFGVSEVQNDVYSSVVKKTDEISSLLLKLMPLFPVLGGLILLTYLHNINRPELFISSIASLYGLVALFLGGALVLSVFALTFMTPWGVLSYVLKERGKHGSWQASIWRVTVTFSAFPTLVVIIASLGVLVPFETYIIMGVVYLFSLLSLLPFDNSEMKADGKSELEKSKIFLQQNAWIFPLSAGMWFAALLCCMPIIVLMKLVESEAIQIGLVMGYVVLSAGLGFGLSKVGGWKIWTMFCGAVSLIVVLYMNGPVLSGAAKLLGIRHDDARWYLMGDSKKTQAILPKSIPMSSDGNYIFAATPFSFGESVVLCNSNNSRIEVDECVTLDRSEVRLSGKAPQ